MRLQHQWGSGLVAAVLLGLVGVTRVAAAGAQFLPLLSIREGARIGKTNAIFAPPLSLPARSAGGSPSTRRPPAAAARSTA